jgi:hypothetical protein
MAPSLRTRGVAGWLDRVRPGHPAGQGLWRNLWMTCAYTPRICGRRGDNAVDFRKATR